VSRATLAALAAVGSLVVGCGGSHPPRGLSDTSTCAQWLAAGSGAKTRYVRTKVSVSGPGVGVGNYFAVKDRVEQGITRSCQAASGERLASVAAQQLADATGASPGSSSPELVMCREVPGSHVVELDALRGGPDGVAVTPVASFPGVPEKTCLASPDLSKLAVLSEASDGSKVAGYMRVGGGFVGLSGHNSNSYSDTPVSDVDPLFNPVSGELWWMVEESGDRESHWSMWSAPVGGGSPHSHGPNNLGGNLAAFTAAGEPIAVSLHTSPDGTLAAFTTKDVWHEDGIELTIGRVNALTADCVRHASHSCGLAQIPFLEGDQSSVVCEVFIGLTSNSAFVCQVKDQWGRQLFDRLDFKLAGSRVKITNDTSLTPPTNMILSDAQVAPDGQTLWYLASRQSASEPTQQTSLYILPTDTPTAEPAPVTLTPSGAVTAAAQVAGWRWHGRFRPGA
jgi:hypothetical protein